MRFASRNWLPYFSILYTFAHSCGLVGMRYPVRRCRYSVKRMFRSSTFSVTIWSLISILDSLPLVLQINTRSFLIVYYGSLLASLGTVMNRNSADFASWIWDYLRDTSGWQSVNGKTRFWLIRSLHRFGMRFSTESKKLLLIIIACREILWNRCFLVTT